jgi:nucleoside-diphosphate-sugar epimerase/rhodanese-related sulfurtransferase
VIRWITPMLGTASAGSGDLGPDIAVVDVRDLVDKIGNSPDAVLAKINQGAALLSAGRRVVVCCDYGISRSNSIAAGILSLHSAISFDEAVNEVRRTTGESEIKLEPLNVVRRALAGGEPQPSRSSEARILITGGSGFIGTAFQRGLGPSAFVVSPSRQTVDLTSGALALDLMVKQSDVNLIVHLANPRVYTSAKAIGDAVTMMRNVLDVCRENHLRLLYLSGWEVYSGYRAAELLADENLPLLPKGPYGEAKMLCEFLVRHYSQQHALKATIIRSSPVYGAGSDRPKFIHNFLAKARSGAQIQTHEYRNGAPCLDLLHIDDLLAALLAAIRVGFAGDFNIGSGRLISTYSIAQSMIEKTRSSSTVDPQKIDDYAPNIRMDYSKASSILGWAPTRAFEDFIDEALRETGGPHGRNQRV